MSWDAPLPMQRRIPVRPSPVFLALVAVFVGAGAFLWSRPNTTAVVNRVGIFVFVAVGWTISLCLHEFMHAVMAWYAGDRGVAGRGYLTLDPRRYMDRQLSIVLPIIFVLIGGIALPGGAVRIDSRLTPTRWRRSLVSAAGPLTNAACAVACALPLALHWVGRSPGSSGGIDVWSLHHHAPLASALAFLALLQVAATVLNALPIPGLDGFGVLAPYLPPEPVYRMMQYANLAFFGIFLVLLYSVRANNAFFDFVFRELAHLGVPRALAEEGLSLFRFWQRL